LIWCVAASSGHRGSEPADLAAAILAAITEAREYGIPEERIIEMLAEIVTDLREGQSS
jgi:hypothetical protein